MGTSPSKEEVNQIVPDSKQLVSGNDARSPRRRNRNGSNAKEVNESSMPDQSRDNQNSQSSDGSSEGSSESSEGSDSSSSNSSSRSHSSQASGHKNSKIKDQIHVSNSLPSNHGGFFPGNCLCGPINMMQSGVPSLSNQNDGSNYHCKRDDEVIGLIEQREQGRQEQRHGKDSNYVE